MSGALGEVSLPAYLPIQSYIDTVLWNIRQGLLFAEGDDHKRQRKIVAPAFSLAANKQYSHIFNEKAKEVSFSSINVAGAYANNKD